jgi:FkbH-like protein/FkbM family methyltransferase
MHRNRDGDNVLLLGLEEWAAPAEAPTRVSDAAHVARCLEGRPRTILPDGREIAHLNEYETDYLYREIFVRRAYARHGVRLPRRGTVVDIGANIGVFSLFVAEQCPDVRILAYEPAPAAFDALCANGRAHAPNLIPVEAGVSDRPGSAAFTYYRQSSVFSGFHANEAADRAALRAIVRRALADQPGVEPGSLDAEVDAVIRDRMQGTRHVARVTSVSEIIREHALDHIDLLKIDAEKCEWEVLAGIAEDDWPRIAQIVVEVHDPTGEATARIEAVISDRGYRCAVDREPALADSGFVTLYAVRPAARLVADDEASRAAARLRDRVGDLRQAIGQFARGGGALTVVVCPRTPAADADDTLHAALDETEGELIADATALPGVRVIPSAALAGWYPVPDAVDPRTRRIGHIPYTAGGFAAIGTAAMRALFHQGQPPVKVIVLDCDGTLWDGVCAEDTAAGVQLTPPHRALQDFMVDRARTGLLLCLCSRNAEADVWAVFHQRPDMPLRREHLTAWRINWGRKSDNLRALAAELNVRLDSFVFLDDDPVECADVRSRCPEVLTLQLPRDAAQIVPFLEHVWAFDAGPATDEDRRRTELYRAEAERQRSRRRIGSLRDFVSGLNLQIDIANPGDDELPRVAQLTQRTNQFNTGGVRRSVGEVSIFLRRTGAAALAVRVADRYGDYGLVGGLLYEIDGDRCAVDTLVLSCRVLGRGVEHAMIADLARRALADGQRRVDIAFRATERNAPARRFLESLGGGPPPDPGAPWTFDAAALASVRFDPDGGQESDRGAASESTRDSADVSASAPAPPAPWKAIQRAADQWRDPRQLAAAIEERRRSWAPRGAPSDGGRDHAPEEVLLDIWRGVLRRAHVDVHDNFFDVGGTSLDAVQVVAQIQRRLRRPMSIVTLFEAPTVAALAARLDRGGGSADASARAARRGRQRRPLTRNRPS